MSHPLFLSAVPLFTRLLIPITIRIVTTKPPSLPSLHPIYTRSPFVDCRKMNFRKIQKHFLSKSFPKKFFFVHFSLHTFPLTSLFSSLFLSLFSSLFSPLLSPYPHSPHSPHSFLHTLIFSPTLRSNRGIIRRTAYVTLTLLRYTSHHLYPKPCAAQLLLTQLMPPYPACLLYNCTHTRMHMHK